MKKVIKLTKADRRFIMDTLLRAVNTRLDSGDTKIVLTVELGENYMSVRDYSISDRKRRK